MDAYDRKARFYPAAVVFAPVTVLLLSLLGPSTWFTGAVGLLAAGGLHFAVLQVVRDLGHAKEERLWKTWGGPPTTQLLRWSDASNPVLQQQRHAEVSAITGRSLPTRAEEKADPAGADHHYEAAVAALRERSRRKGIALVATQNAIYGFRRNTYGCRALGLAVAALTSAVQVALAVFGGGALVTVARPLMAGGAAFSAVWLLLWIIVITPSFVRRGAERYAEALIESARSEEDVAPDART